MKTLHLPLKKEWYDMIERGVKTEEYREIKPYWINRLLKWGDIWGSVEDIIRLGSIGMLIFKDYRKVKFSYGYTKRTMTFRIKYIMVGKGRKVWGAPDEDVFIINIGERL